MSLSLGSSASGQVVCTLPVLRSQQPGSPDQLPRGILHGGPSGRTTVVVRGQPNPLQAAGRDAGLKLMEIKRLGAKGHRITLLSERQFWRLAARR